jgi:acylphosphatase
MWTTSHRLSAEKTENILAQVPGASGLAAVYKNWRRIKRTAHVGMEVNAPSFCLSKRQRSLLARRVSRQIRLFFWGVESEPGNPGSRRNPTLYCFLAAVYDPVRGGKVSGSGRSVRRRVLFSGDVQGVGFRYRTLHVAGGFSVAGFVRNLSDGRVELVCEGEAEQVDRFVAAVAFEMKGHINDVAGDSAAATGEFHGFEIRH